LDVLFIVFHICNTSVDVSKVKENTIFVVKKTGKQSAYLLKFLTGLLPEFSSLTHLHWILCKPVNPNDYDHW